MNNSTRHLETSLMSDHFTIIWEKMSAVTIPSPKAGEQDLPHCRAEQKCRLQRHHIWPSGHDPLPGQAPSDRRPGPSAAWSGSWSLKTKEITAKKGKGKNESLLSFQLPFGILIKAKRQKKWMKEGLNETVEEKRKKESLVELLKAKNEP